MIDLDTLVQEFRAQVPVRDHDVATVARRASEATPGAPPQARGRVGSALPVALGAVATAGLAGVLLFLLIASPDTPTTTSGAARVHWGVRATVRVVPDAGVGLVEATDRAMAAIHERAAQRDAAGVEVVRVADGELVVTAPGAVDKRMVRTFLGFPRLSIYEDDSVVASVSRLNRLNSVVRRVAPGAPIVGYAVAFPADPTSVQAIVPTLERAKAKARRYAGQTAAREQIFAIPKGYFVVSRSSDAGKAVQLVRDAPLIRSADISAVSVRGNALAVKLTDEGRRRLSRWQRDELTGSIRTRRRYGTIITTAPPPSATFPTRQLLADIDLSDDGWVRDDELRVTTFQRRFTRGDVVNLRSSLAVPNASTLEVVDGERYGARPALTGDVTLAPLDGRGRAFSGAVRVATARSGSRTVDAWARRDSSGNDAYVVRERADSRSASGQTPRFRADVSGNLCNLAIGTPAVTGCGGFGLANPVVAIGRVRNDVARVEVELVSGQIVPAVVSQGWYLAFEAREERPPDEEIIRPASIRQIAAYGADGQQLGITESWAAGVVSSP